MTSLYDNSVDFPKNNVSACSLILFGLLSNNLANLPGVAIRSVNRVWHQLHRFFFLRLELYLPVFLVGRRQLSSQFRMWPAWFPTKEGSTLTRSWNLTFVTIYFFFILIFRLWGEQWLCFQCIHRGLSQHQAKFIFTEIWAHWDLCAFYG